MSWLLTQSLLPVFAPFLKNFDLVNILLVLELPEIVLPYGLIKLAWSFLFFSILFFNLTLLYQLCRL